MVRRLCHIPAHLWTESATHSHGASFVRAFLCSASAEFSMLPYSNLNELILYCITICRAQPHSIRTINHSSQVLPASFPSYQDGTIGEPMALWELMHQRRVSIRSKFTPISEAGRYVIETFSDTFLHHNPNLMSVLKQRPRWQIHLQIAAISVMMAVLLMLLVTTVCHASLVITFYDHHYTL